MLTKAPLLPLRYPVERLYQSLFVLSDVSTAIYQIRLNDQIIVGTRSEVEDLPISRQRKRRFW
jgi:hypothetical protein